MRYFFILALAASFLFATSAHADLVFSSGFDGNTGAHVFAGNTDNTTGSSTVTITDWTLGSFTSSVSGLTAISTGDSGTSGGFAQTQGGSATYANANNIFLSRNHNTDTDRTTSQRGYSFEFTLSTAVDLDNLIVLSGHTNNSGNQDQSFTSDLFYELSGGTLGSAVGGSSNEDYAVAPAYHSVDFDLTGASLGVGTYTLKVWQSNMPDGGAYATYDGITLNGFSAVPEPSSLWMIGMLATLGLKRRRA